MFTDHADTTMQRRLTKSECLLWIEALESGKYNQTSHCLKDDHGFCCLGVLAEILDFKSVDDQVLQSWVPDSPEYPDMYYAVHDLLTATNQADLATMNDGGTNFPAIAAYIRTNYLHLYPDA